MHAPTEHDDRSDAHLPVIESDRDLDDWGRSARFTALLDRTVGETAYKVWFRVDVDGLDAVPGSGGALLVAASGGPLSPVLPLLGKAVRDEHPRRREVRPCVEPRLLDQPGLAVALVRAGAVAGRPADLDRLLGDEGRLVSVGVRDDRLADEHAGAGLGSSPALRSAIRSGVPVVPVAAVGATDAQPVFGRLPLPGGRRLPVTVGFPHLGPLGLLLFLPAKVRLRALQAVVPSTIAGGHDAERAVAVAREVARRLRRGREALESERRSRWLG